MKDEIFLEKVNPSPNLCSSRDLSPKLPKEGWGERQGVEETVLVHGLRDTIHVCNFQLIAFKEEAVSPDLWVV